MTVADASFVIVSAGRGERFGNRAKVLLPIAGKPMLAWSIEAAFQAVSVREIVVVAGDHTLDAIAALVRDIPSVRPVSVVPGGATRQESVAAGVAATSDDAAIVLVHDAARPLVTPDLIEGCVRSARDHGGVIAAMPVTDTLKQVTAHHIDRTVPREHLWAAQTPQAFRRETLVSALAWSREHPAVHTDEASILEAMGIPVTIVQGAVSNLKVTHPDDLVVAEALLAVRIAEGRG